MAPRQLGNIDSYMCAQGSLTCTRTHMAKHVHNIKLIHNLVGLQMGIANRDIKLENTLLMDTSERPQLKLCDFGYSKDELCASISKTMCGKVLICT